MNPLFVCGLLALVAVVGAHPEWESFKSTHGKKYGSALEESLRKTIFFQNKEKVERFNKEQAEEAGYTMGLNHLSDRTQDEIGTMNGYRKSEARSRNSMKAHNFFTKMLASANGDIPESVDWRKVGGIVSPVKDQGFCGSCWAFSVTGALEGQMKVRKGKLDPLSEQNLIDCSKQNYGCNGGDMVPAYEDIHTEGGIEDEIDYPYGEEKGSCRFNQTKVVFSDVAAYALTSGDEELLKKTVATFGPVSVAIDASLDGFINYQSGIFYDKNCKKDDDNLGHAVLVVGYGSDPRNGDYWIVKNSWAESWGDMGYIKMARNKNNNCGIATAASIPTF